MKNIDIQSANNTNNIMNDTGNKISNEIIHDNNNVHIIIGDNKIKEKENINLETINKTKNKNSRINNANIELDFHERENKLENQDISNNKNDINKRVINMIKEDDNNKKIINIETNNTINLNNIDSITKSEKTNKLNQEQKIINNVTIDNKHNELINNNINKKDNNIKDNKSNYDKNNSKSEEINNIKDIQKKHKIINDSNKMNWKQIKL